MKPTVSVTIAVWPSPSLTWRLVGSSVAKSLSSARATSLPDEGVEQGRLAGVRVADDGDGRHEAPVAAPGGGRPLLADVLDPLLHLLDPLADEPPVGLELGLAGAAGADAAAGPRQVRPHAGQARQLVLQLGQLHLEAPLVGPGVLGEDVEDQAAPVDDLDLEELLEGALLARRQLVVGDEDAEAGLRLRREQLLGLALARRTSSGRRGGGSATRRRRPRRRPSRRGEASSARLSSACQPGSSPVSTATRNAFSTGGARSIVVMRGMTGGYPPAQESTKAPAAATARSTACASRRRRGRGRPARAGTTCAGGERRRRCGGR